MNLIRIILLFAVIDVLAAAALASDWSWMKFAGWLVLAKGIYSLTFSLSSKNYFDILGYIDVFVGIVILTPLAVPYLWVLPLSKALLSLIGK